MGAGVVVAVNQNIKGMGETPTQDPRHPPKTLAHPPLAPTW